MSHDFRATQHVEADAIFALAAEELSEREANAANAHLVLCRGCRRLYAGARELQREGLRLGDAAARGVDDLTHRRLWQSLAPEAAAAAERVQHRRAWSIVLASPRLRWAAAIVVLMGGLLVYGLGRGPQPPPAEAAIGGASAAQRQARAVEPPPALGPGSRSKLAGSLSPSPSPRGKARQHRRRVRRWGTGRRQSPVAMDLDLTGPLTEPLGPPPPAPAALKPSVPAALTPSAPAALTPAPGERKLRCGGLLASRGATVRILRDQPRAALIRLSTGRIGMRVPKLPRGGRVEIVTPDALVRVVGTRFTVKRGPRPETTVTVTEGVVRVTPTGRNRKTVVLRAGDSRTVLGEGAYLKQLRGQLAAALSAGRLKDAARLGRQYLAVTSKPAHASTMKLRLAGIVARLGLTAEAVKLYEDVLGAAPHAVARQNALAFLARLYERLGKTHKALGIWRGLVKKYPDGLFTVDALMALVRAGCRQAGAQQDHHRKQLAKRAARHRAARVLLRRCRSGGRRR
jgi:hypothetical protein